MSNPESKNTPAKVDDYFDEIFKKYNPSEAMIIIRNEDGYLVDPDDPDEAFRDLISEDRQLIKK